MLQCVGCCQTLKNPKGYSNHQQTCRKYKAAGALRLRQMQLNRAKKVERAWAPQVHVTADEEPNELVEPTQDLNNELVVVCFLSQFTFSGLTCEYRKTLFLYWGRQDVLINMLNYLLITGMELHQWGNNAPLHHIKTIFLRNHLPSSLQIWTKLQIWMKIQFLGLLQTMEALYFKLCPTSLVSTMCILVVDRHLLRMSYIQYWIPLDLRTSRPLGLLQCPAHGFLLLGHH